MMMTLLANPPKFTSLSTARQIYHWPAHNLVNLEFCLFHLSFSSHPRILQCLKSYSTGDKQFTNEKISNLKFTSQIQNSCVEYIPLLCRIWPGFKQKSSLFLPTKSWNDTNTCALIFLLDFPWWWDQNYSSANYMHCSIKLSVTVHKFTISHPKLFPLAQLSLAAEPQTFSLRVVTWVRSLLGVNVTLMGILYLVEYPSVLK